MRDFRRTSRTVTPHRASSWEHAFNNPTCLRSRRSAVATVCQPPSATGVPETRANRAEGPIGAGFSTAGFPVAARRCCCFGPLAAGTRNSPAIPDVPRPRAVPSLYRATYKPLETFHSMKVARILPPGVRFPLADLLTPGTANAAGVKQACSPQAWLAGSAWQVQSIARLCPLPEDRNQPETLSINGFQRLNCISLFGKPTAPHPRNPIKPRGPSDSCAEPKKSLHSLRFLCYVFRL